MCEFHYLNFPVMIQVLDRKRHEKFYLFEDASDFDLLIEKWIHDDPDCYYQYVFEFNGKYYSGLVNPSVLKITKRTDAVWDNYDKFWDDIYENFCYHRNEWSLA